MGYLLEMKNMVKQYSGVTVLKDVSLQLNGGEVMCLVGENGAGKSTLIKLLSGSVKPTSGEIYINGEKQTFSSPYDALSKGVSVIYQELNYYPDLTVGENMFAGRLPLHGTLKTVDWSKVYSETDRVLQELGMNISSKTLVGDLTVAQKQFLEIAKAISRENSIVVMDEPTASLNEAEVESLFHQIEQLKRRGVAVIYISHRLEEVFRIADKIKVLRDGQDVGTVDYKDATREGIIKLMVGRELSEMHEKIPHRKAGVLLEVKNLSNSVVHDISLYARAGEVVSIFGLMGNGAPEILESIFGVRANESAEITVEGKKTAIKSPREAIQHGLAYIPPERKVDGLILEHSIKQNVVTPSIDEYTKAFIIDDKQADIDTAALIEQLKIRATGAGMIVESLSGGNQQKVLIGKWIRKRPKVLMVCEPTRGVDIATKLQIYSLMEDLCEAGLAIIMVTPELPEILGVSDRVYVVKSGRIVGELQRGEMSQESIMSLAVQ